MQQSRLAGDIEYWRQGSMKTLEDDTMKHDNFPYVGCIGAIKQIYGKFCNREE